MSSRVVINSISITAQLASDIEHLRGIVQKDLRRVQKHRSSNTLGHGPLSVREARSKKTHHHHQGAPSGSPSSQPEPAASTGDAVTVTDATVTYMMNARFGGPNAYSLLIDTGSSNTWVGANKPLNPDSTYESTRKAVQVSYGSGSFSGVEYIGTIVLGDGSSELEIKKQSFAVASKAQGFSGMDGILGIGPVDLTSATVAGEDSIPTVADNLLAQGIINTECIGISYCPTTTNGNMANGELMFGGVDESKMTAAPTYVPITSQSPACKYWGIDQAITYGPSRKPILKKTAGIVDTGTTLIMLAADAFEIYQKETGAVMDQATGLLKVTPEQFKNMQSMNFEIGDASFELTPNAQIWPRALNSALGGDERSIYLVFASMGENSGTGLDFINGFTMLQRFYSIFDTSNNRVGIATTDHTNAETN